MKMMFIGDIVGSGGRKAVRSWFRNCAANIIFLS